MKRVSLRKILAWMAIAAAVALIAYRVNFSPVSVSKHALSSGEVRAEVLGTGTLEARVKTTISPRVSEQLAEVLVDQGDTVKAGQLLARLAEQYGPRFASPELLRDMAARGKDFYP